MSPIAVIFRYPALLIPSKKPQICSNVQTLRSSDIHQYVQISPSPLWLTSSTHGCLPPSDASFTIHDSSYFHSSLWPSLRIHSSMAFHSGKPLPTGRCILKFIFSMSLNSLEAHVMVPHIPISSLLTSDSRVEALRDHVRSYGFSLQVSFHTPLLFPPHLTKRSAFPISLGITLGFSA